MNAPILNLISATVRLTRMRVKNRHGCIAFGHRIDLATGLNDRSSTLVVSVSAAIAEPANIAIGGIYEVYGEASSIQRTHGSYTVLETQIEAQDVRLVRPSGSQLIQWLADHAAGIREVKATKLWDALGERLYDALDNQDHDAIAPVIVSKHVRDGLFEKWAENGDAKTLRFVQERDIPLDLARKVIKFHKKNTIAALIEDPYRLLSFEGSWQRVDGIARDKFSVALDDPRRLAAALEEALYRVSEKGHTCASLDDLEDTVFRLVKPYSASLAAMSKALIQGKASGQFICRETETGDIMLHAPGTYIMERQCA
ncbi:MAG: putative ATP-dependent exoDNAse (exonuclease V) subunit alpha, partial [Pseudomonas sp. 63_8]